MLTVNKKKTKTSYATGIMYVIYNIYYVCVFVPETEHTYKYYYTAEYLKYSRLFFKVWDKNLSESRFRCKILWLIIKYTTIIYQIMRYA